MMRIIVTAEEIIDSGSWDDFCEKHGINVWSVNEGLMDGDEEFILSEEEAKSYGLISR